MGYENIVVPFRGWTVIREIGQGGFGKVYEIRRDQYGIVERSAMKVIAVPQNPNEISTYLRDGYDPKTLRKMYDGSRASVLREYQTMIRLKDCSHIVRCEDIEIVMDPDGIGSKIYIRMELLTPIREYEKLRSFNGEEVIKLGSDICDMLVRCEAEGIIHRDIKPDNIMVSGQGEYKLGDFGIARSMEHTTMATRIGTINYMAPEVFLGRKYGHTADIYSLGLVLYWLLNNKRMPFFPQNNREINNNSAKVAQEQRMIGNPVPRPVNGRPGLCTVVLKALAYDPADRYQSALEFGNEIRKCLSEEKISERSHISENDITDVYSQNASDVFDETEPLDMENEWRRRYEEEMSLRREAERRFRNAVKKLAVSKEEGISTYEKVRTAGTEVKEANLKDLHKIEYDSEKRKKEQVEREYREKKEQEKRERQKDQQSQVLKSQDWEELKEEAPVTLTPMAAFRGNIFVILNLFNLFVCLVGSNCRLYKNRENIEITFSEAVFLTGDNISRGSSDLRSSVVWNHIFLLSVMGITIFLWFLLKKKKKDTQPALAGIGAVFLIFFSDEAPYFLKLFMKGINAPFDKLSEISVMINFLLFLLWAVLIIWDWLEIYKIYKTQK